MKRKVLEMQILWCIFLNLLKEKWELLWVFKNACFVEQLRMTASGSFPLLSSISYISNKQTLVVVDC